MIDKKIEEIVDQYIISHKGGVHCKCISGARGHLIAKLQSLFKEHAVEGDMGKNWYFEGDELVITRGKWVVDRYPNNKRLNIFVEDDWEDFCRGEIKFNWSSYGKQLVKDFIDKNYALRAEQREKVGEI